MKTSTFDQASPATQSSSLRQFLALTKPTISMLVVVTAVPSLFMATTDVSFRLLASTILGTWLTSASAAVLNHLFESDIDEKMVRTRKRPLPSGKVSSLGAFGFSAALGIFGLAFLAAGTTTLAAIIAFIAILFYGLFYTGVLKRNTPQNIVIGGAAGAVGPLIGWAAASGTIGWEAWAQFAIIFLWTPPHFWALAIKYLEDYKAADLPMYPVVYGVSATKRLMFFYTTTLLPVIAAMYFFGQSSWIFFTVSFISTLRFCWLAYELSRDQLHSTTMKLFRYSCYYVLIVFGSLAADALLLGPGSPFKSSEKISEPATVVFTFQR